MIGDILQPTHLLFILVVALLVLGPKRLPEASRAIGKGIRDFRMAVSGDEPDHGAMLSTPPMPTGATAPYAPVATSAAPVPTPMEPMATPTEPMAAPTVPVATPAPPPADATAPAFAADPAVPAPEAAATPASEPTAEPTGQPTEPAQPVA